MGLYLAHGSSFVAGAGFAAVFPSILSFVGDRYPHLSGTAFSLVLVMALTGGTLLPLATGVLGDRFGLQRSLLIVPAALVCAAALYLMVRRHLDPAPHAAAAWFTVKVCVPMVIVPARDVPAVLAATL